MVQSEALASCLDDPGAGGLGEPESGHLQLGHLQKSDVVGDCADNHGNPVAAGVSIAGFLPLGAEVLYQAGQGDGRAVHARGDQSPHHGLSEGGAGSPCEEAEQLTQ